MRAPREGERADLSRVVQILREANYQGWVVLEYESKEDAWTGVPPLLAELKQLLDKPAAPQVDATF